MLDRKIAITPETYVVREKLETDAYHVKTDPYHLNEKAQSMRGEAGVSLEFYARIPGLETREERELLRKFELDTTETHEGAVSPRFIKEFFALDGLYLLSNIKTSDGKLKLVQDVEGGEPGATRLRELDEHWEVYLDPVTANLMGYGKQNEQQKVNPISAEVLERIEKIRLQMGLTREDILYRIQRRKELERIR